MKCAIAIFAKTIGLSSVKTRLAEDIGQKPAEAFYRLSVDAVEEVAFHAEQDFGVKPVWALGEKEATGLPQWQSFPALWTGEGGLGARLATLSEALFTSHDAVMFIGTDSPQLNPSVFGQALDILRSNPQDCVAGPALDGGFYLFVTGKPVPRDVWEAVGYSAETTLEDLKQRSGRKFHMLQGEQDVDVVEDLEPLRQRLAADRQKLLPKQALLLDWLKDHLDVAV